MARIGLKLWSTNLNYLSEVGNLFTQKVFDYIELFVVPGSTGTIPDWQGLSIPYVLHAPHSAAGLNPAEPARREHNMNLVRQVNDFFMALSPSWVIFHPGVNGDLQEAILQLRSFGDRYSLMREKLAIENKPSCGLNGERCLGESPAAVRKLCEASGLRFCLDFTHAICYAQTVCLEWKSVAKDFLALEPVIFHVCDGHYAEKDEHKHFGEGEFDVPAVVGMLPADCVVTIETPKTSSTDLSDFVKDVAILRKHIRAYS